MFKSPGYNLTFCLCLITQLFFGQSIKRINTLNGLSNNTILSIIQDKKGYLWIGTDDGLNRFDGHSFTIFKPDLNSQNSISHTIAKILYEDSNGNIWIGTDGSGLNKFNPITEEFENFYFDPKDNNSLSYNNVSAITEDRDHNIWIGTYGGGLNKLDLKTRKFTRFQNEANNPNSISGNFINSILVDHQNTLWIGTWGGGLCALDLRQMNFKTFFNNPSNKNSLSDNTVNCLYKDHQNQLWIGTWGSGMDMLNLERNQFTHYKSGNNPDNLNHDIVRAIYGDNQGNIWIGTYGGGLDVLSTKTKKIRHYTSITTDQNTISNNNIWTVFCSSDQSVWIGTIDGGLNQLYSKPQYFFSLNNFSNENNPVSSLSESKKHQMLIGTDGSGFYICDSNLQVVKTIKRTSSQNSLTNNTVNKILEDKFDNLWIGTQNGLDMYNPSSGNFKHFKQAYNNYRSISFNAITDILEDHLGTIWIATWGGGINRFNRQEEFDYFLNLKKTKITFLVDMSGQKISPEGIHIAGSMNGWNPTSDHLKLVTGNIYGITLLLYPVRTEYKFLNGNKWGTEENVPQNCALNSNRVIYPGNQDIALNAVLFGKGCNTIANEPLAIEPSDETVLSSNHVYCLFEDREGSLWAGTNQGLNRFNAQDELFISYRNIRGDTTSLSDNHVSCIYEDKRGNLWLGTLGGGLNLFDKKNHLFKTFREKDGLANNNIHAILEDEEGKLWLSTNSGISRFDFSNKSFRNYDSYDGLQNHTFRNEVALKRHDHKLFFGGTNGLVYFNAQSLGQKSTPPIVYISDLFIQNKRIGPGKTSDGRTILRKSIFNSEKISLSYKDNIISFHFSAIQFSTPEKIRYQYKLEGFDNQWHETSFQNTIATYTNLDGGDYTFLVKASSSNGDWNETPTYLKIHITAPFWKTVWFWLLFATITLYLAYTWYRKQIIRKNKKLAQDQILNEKKIVELEKQQLTQEVEKKNAELGTITMQMIHKSKFINEQINRLTSVKNSSEPATKEKLNRLIGKLNKDLNLENEWKYFELHFDKVYQNFISNLKSKYPELHASDIQLAAYIRMSLSTKEISELMNISLRGIESRRYRLRKVFNLNKGENLTDFLFKL